MPFTAANRVAIVNALNLERHQQTSQSRLQVLLRNTEVFDEQYGTTVVAQVQALLEQITLYTNALYGDPDTDLDIGKTADDGIYSVAIPNEVTIMRKPVGGGDASTPYYNKLISLKSKLKNLIDPDDVLGAVTEGGNILF
jgi:hypothetical protein